MITFLFARILASRHSHLSQAAPVNPNGVLIKLINYDYSFGNDTENFDCLF